MITVFRAVYSNYIHMCSHLYMLIFFFKLYNQDYGSSDTSTDLSIRRIFPKRQGFFLPEQWMTGDPQESHHHLSFGFEL